MPLGPATLARDLARAMSDLPQTATFSRPGAGRFSAPVAAGQAGGSLAFGEGASGLAPDDAVTIVAALADCAFAPRPGDAVAIAGWARRYRVASARVVPGDAAVELSLEAS